MNALLTQFRRDEALVGELTRTAPSPLVVDVGEGCVLWIQNGVGYTLSPVARTWSPLGDGHANGIGGRVMSSGEVAELVLSVGRPT